MKSILRASSYCVIDNSAAGRPKTREEEEFFGVREFEMVHCKHCQACIKIFRHVPQTGLWCSKCNGYVCDNAKCGTECYPWSKRMDDFVERSHLSDRFKQEFGVEPPQDVRSAWEQFINRLRITL